MLNISRIRPCENNKGCRISLHESKKLVLQFSEFPTIFYTFYKILQSCNTIEDGIYHRDPCKESGKCNWVPRPWEAASPAEFRRAGGAPGRASGGTRLGAHLGTTGGRSWDGGAAGVGDRRRGGSTAAGVRRRHDEARRRGGFPEPWGARAHGEGASRAEGPRAARGAWTPRAAGTPTRRAVHGRRDVAAQGALPRFSFRWCPV
jgi:hypothetical protein